MLGLCLVDDLKARIAEGGIERVGGRQVAQRSEGVQNLLGGFFRLAEAFEVTDGPIVVFNADSQQRERAKF